MRIFLCSSSCRAGISDTFFLIFATISTAAAGYVLNDWADFRTDALNKADKTFVGQSISRKKAGYLFFGLQTGTLVAFAAGPEAGFFALACAAVSLIYSLDFKNRPFAGNFSVALLTAAPAAFFLLFEPENREIILRFSAFSFLLNWARELIKDAEDEAGDKQAGRRTFPLVYGKPAVRKFAGILVSGLMLLIWDTFRRFPSPAVGAAVLAMSLGFLFFVRELSRAEQKADFSRLSRYCKIWTAAGILFAALL